MTSYPCNASCRTKLAIIPQDPVLFSGTIRFQLDPFDDYSDTEIWEVLRMVMMDDTIKTMPGALSAIVAENGDNLSQGQRQLLCIARAFLRRSRILVMDEATSAVDPATDRCIQMALRNGSVHSGTTVLTIAHRLQTIVDYDKIMVLKEGVVLEFDTPSNLLSDNGSVFARMYNGAL
jgi:ATP-binding cassette subfamily C (CFTR/MRP) protein 1